jgi:hypothetical protein
MSLPIRILDSGLMVTGQGQVKGLIINSHTSGTIKLIDGLEATAAVAVGTITQSVGAAGYAVHASSIVTSSGTNVAASHAATVLTVSGAVNFKDAVKGSGYITSDNTNPSAGQVIVLGAITYTWRALGGTTINSATAVDVPLGNNATESMNNLYNAFLTHPLVDTVRTSALVITVTAKTAGTAGNLTATENSTHTVWDDGSLLTGGLYAETVTIGSKVYTFKDTLDTASTATAVQVKIAATSALSLVNLKLAINATAANVGSACGIATAADTLVVATASDATTLTITARIPGTVPNAYATTETCASAAWAGATMTSGTAGVTTAGATITIGSIVYTQVTALSETSGAVAIAYQFLRGATEATSLDNLKLVINATAASVGVKFSTGTVAHPYVIATTNSDTQQTVVARTVGSAALTATINALATTETGANLAWEATTLGAGTGSSVTAVTTDTAGITIGTRQYIAVKELDETSGATATVDQILWVTNEATFLDNIKKAINLTGTAGTDYSTGTTINIDVIATTNGNTTQVIQSKLNGLVGNAIATTATLTNYAWGATTLASGTGATGKVICNTITLPATAALTEYDTFMDLGDADFTRGVSVVVGGTLDATLLVELTDCD